MGRWEPDARGRLALAAVELYVERGFEQTTVADIAERAGLTERTFFRHFADKREVLFTDQIGFEDAFARVVSEAPVGMPPLDAVALAVNHVAEVFEPRLPWSRERQLVIDANPGLQERELIKLAGVSSAIAAILRDRGVGEPAASLAAQSGTAVFTVAFQLWITAGNTRPFVDLVAESFASLRGVTAG